MLRCLGIPATSPTDFLGNNFGVIQSAEIPEGELKKKHIAISYHYVREAIAEKIVNAHWCRSYENFAYTCTKALGTNVLYDLVTKLMAGRSLGLCLVQALYPSEFATILLVF